MPLPRQPDAPGRYIPAPIRALILEISEGICFYCGLPGSTIDHLHPWSSGGDHHPMNLVQACGSCNSIAGDRVFPAISDKIAYVAERRERLQRAGLDPYILGDRAGSIKIPKNKRALAISVTDDQVDIMWGDDLR